MRWMSTVGRTAVTLVVLLVVLVGGFFWGYGSVQKATAPKPPPPCMTIAAQTLYPNQVTVRVYNGGSVTGLAAAVASSLRGKGFIVTRATNTDEHIMGTVVVGAQAENPEVRLVAGQFEKVTIRPDGRPDGTVDVLVGDQYGGLAATPPASLEIPGGTVCLPTPSAIPTSSGTPGVTPAATPTPTPTPTKTKR